MLILNHIFGSLLRIAIILAGIALIVAPAHGRQMFKNVAVFTILFVLGIVLLQTCYSTLSAGW
jgi:hypothetical protein